MEDKPKRKRVHIKPPIEAIIIADPQKYGANGASLNARKFDDHIESHNCELWIDFHCSLRQLERVGIDFDRLTSLATRSLRHLYYYQFRYPKFRFVQFHPEFKGENKRVLLQEESITGELLNLVIDYHFIEVGQYEMTFVTAMVENNFKVFDGQYILYIDGDKSILKRFVNNATIIVAEVE